MLTFGFLRASLGARELSGTTGRGTVRLLVFRSAFVEIRTIRIPRFSGWMREDAFWAARQVAAFTDEEIRALVETGEYSDPRAAEWIANCLIKRRDKIAAAWFSKRPAVRQVPHRGWQADVRGSRRARRRRKRPRILRALGKLGRRRQIRSAALRRLAAGCQRSAMIRSIWRRRSRPPRTMPGDDPVTVYIRRGKNGPEVVGIDR